MRCIAFAVSIAMCGCVHDMVRAPKTIPADGAVVCTDSTATPLAALAGAAAAAGIAAYGLTHEELALENGGVLWIPVAGTLSLQLLFTAGDGYGYATECSDAKRTGAEIARRNDAAAKARAEAGALWKRAAAAARADDCVTVRELDPQVRALDVELHDVVFARDVAIARCLATRE